MKGRMIHTVNNKINFQPYSLNKKESIHSVSRSKLNNLLISTAENYKNIEIQFGMNLINVEEKNLRFDNGKFIPSKDFIIGADGVGSQIRKYINLNSSNPSYFNPLGHSYKELKIDSDKNGDFQLDPNSLHIWPRGEFMLIALPNTDKSFTCTLFMPNKGNISFESIKNSDDVLKFFEHYFDDLIPMLDDFPHSFFDKPAGKLATIYASDWKYKNYCLIGDAAHAIVPFFGQGMNASFEDCVILSDIIKKEKGNLDKSFINFSKQRKPDTDAIAKMAIENYIEMRDSVVKKKYLKRKKITNELYNRFPTRFIPRYNMVSFTSIPYSLVYKRSKIQEEIVSKLINTNIDLTFAETLIKKKLPEV